MATPILRRHAVIKCISEIDPSFDNFYKDIILSYYPNNTNLSNSFKIIRNNIYHESLRDYLSNTANNLSFELLYKKLFDPSFSEEDFVEFI